jgi:hypothetical protein
MKRTLVVLVLLLSLAAFTQEKEDRALLNWDQMRAIINEASGERAMHHILELVPYPRVRPKSEWEGTFRESGVMARFARQYGYRNVEIESFPGGGFGGGRSWFATQGELWMVEPELRKIYDIHDVAISLGSNSETGDITAELIDVGSGARVQDYEGKNVTGKIVLGSASGTVLQRLGLERGAVGVISYSTLYPDSQPDAITSSGISASGPGGKGPGFGWIVAARVGRELSARLARGEKVVMRSVVQADFVPGEMEVVHAMIPGDGSSTQEIAVSAHLYEGYIKQGANDDNSGCAVTLEMGRTLIRLINEGKLPKPKRNIHFLWVPEISGTRAWLNKHEDVKKRLIADLNFDMEGLSLAKNGSYWTMHRTPDTFPSFINDIGANLIEFVSNTNRERVRYRHNGYRFTLPVLAPNGTRDPFYTLVEKHYGASDHVEYMRHGIPAVIFVTWPDPYYHSSLDIPQQLDSTQFKRVAVVGAAAAAVMAAADDEMAARIAGEVLARGSERLGQAERKGMAYLADAKDAGLAAAYRDALVTIKHQAAVEKGALRSAAVFFRDPEEGKKKLAPLEAVIEQRAAALQAGAKAFFELQAAQRQLSAAEPPPSDAEKQLARMIVEGGAAGGGPPQRGGGPAPSRVIPQHMSAELAILRTRKMTALEIRDFLSGEFEPIPLPDFLEYVQAQAKSGALKVTEKPEPPPPPPPVKGRAKRK